MRLEAAVGEPRLGVVGTMRSMARRMAMSSPSRVLARPPQRGRPPTPHPHRHVEEPDSLRPKPAPPGTSGPTLNGERTTARHRLTKGGAPPKAWMSDVGVLATCVEDCPLLRPCALTVQGVLTCFQDLSTLLGCVIQVNVRYR